MAKFHKTSDIDSRSVLATFSVWDIISQLPAVVSALCLSVIGTNLICKPILIARINEREEFCWLLNVQSRLFRIRVPNVEEFFISLRYSEYILNPGKRFSTSQECWIENSVQNVYSLYSHEWILCKTLNKYKLIKSREKCTLVYISGLIKEQKEKRKTFTWCNTLTEQSEDQFFVISFFPVFLVVGKIDEKSSRFVIDEWFIDMKNYQPANQLKWFGCAVWNIQ